MKGDTICDMRQGDIAYDAILGDTMLQKCDMLDDILWDNIDGIIKLVSLRFYSVILAEHKHKHLVFGYLDLLKITRLQMSGRQTHIVLL